MGGGRIGKRAQFSHKRVVEIIYYSIREYADTFDTLRTRGIDSYIYDYISLF